jgi:hypothetical protein
MLLRQIRTLGIFAVAVSMVALSVGCAETVGDIDRTQPDKIHKSLFRADKTWYFKQTVVDVPPTASFVFEGIGSDIFKIRWEIRQGVLIAWRSHEHVPGMDPKAVHGCSSWRKVDTDLDGTDDESVCVTWQDVGQTEFVPGDDRGTDPEYYKESAIGAWEILDHFDVIRQYNSTTGEQSNVLVENREDRPWHERDYMRVKWHANTVDNWNMIDPGLSGYSELVSEGEEGIASKDSMHFEDAEGNIYTHGERRIDDGAVYFDYTVNWHLSPQFCFTGSPNNCVPEHVVVRNSFARIDNDRDQDYEMAVHDDLSQSKFGYFRTERLVYDRRRGFTDSSQVFLANRHRTWESSYKRHDCAAVDASLTDIGQQIGESGVSKEKTRLLKLDEARLGPAKEACDAGETPPFERTLDGDKMPLAMADRTPDPIVYVLSENHPAKLMGTAREITAEWNRAFRRATAHGCGIEVPDGTDVGAVPVCELDTCANLKAAGCIPDMFVLDENLSCRADTRSERRHCTRNGDVRKNFIYWVDQPQQAGPLGFGPSYADPETGELISGTAYVYGAAVDSYATKAMDIVDVLGGFLTIEDLADGEQVKAYIDSHRNRLDPRRIAKAAADAEGMSLDEFMALDVNEALELLMPEKIRQRTQIIAMDGLPEGNPLFEQVQADKIKGTDFEHLLLNDEMVNVLMRLPEVQQIAPDWRPGEPIPDEARELINPANWAYGSAMREMDEERTQFFARKSVLMADFVDDSIIGLALNYQNESDPEEVYQDLRRKIYRAVMLHEVGHTVGLRHNFEGSFDSINYFDQYWNLRDENLGYLAEQDNQGIQEIFNEADVTTVQKEGRMREYGYSSIMDYGAKFNSDIQGLGRYDEAAVLFGYAHAVEVFETPRADVLSRLRDYMLRLGYDPGFDFEQYLYDTWENRTHPQDPHPLKHFNYTHVPYFLGGLDGIRSRKVVDYTGLADLRTDDERPADLALEVPYMFCGDEWVNSIMTCNRWDEGANYHEINATAVSAYRNYYFFDHFRRDRKDFSPQSVMSRVYTRYFRLRSDTYRFGLFSGVFWGGLPDPVLRYLWQSAIVSGLNTLLDVVSTPEYGTYVRADDGRYHLLKRDIDPRQGFTVPMGLGRRRFTRYFWEEGYEYYRYPLESGHFWDYLAAMMTLTESSFSVLGVEVDADFRTYSIPYYLLFSEKLTRWFNGMAMRDSDAFGPRVVEEGGAPGLRFMTSLDEPDGDPLDIRPNFTMQFYALLYGMQSFQSNYSLHYVDQMQVFRLGGGEQVNPGEGYDLLTFQDPFTGHQYGTFKNQDGYERAGEFEILVPPPVQLIEQLNRWRADWEELPENDRTKMRLEQQMNNGVETLNMIRGLYGVFGSVF